jgi:hypothetical protein
VLHSKVQDEARSADDVVEGATEVVVVGVVASAVVVADAMQTDEQV